MEHRELGTNGPRIPAIMFGAWPIAGGMGSVPEDTAIATIRRAIDLGITAIDTAEYYRTSESVIGKAIADIPRDRLFLATKVSAGPFTRARIQEALEHSLRALGTDYVDLYQLHSFPQGVALEEAMVALAETQQAGKARSIGVSNFSGDQVAAASEIQPFQSLQPRFNLLDSEAARDIIPFCASHGIGVIAHSPLAKGLLTGKYRPGHVFPADDERGSFPRFQGETFARYLAKVDQLSGIAEAKGCSMVQLAVAWVLAQPGITSAIVGAKTPEQIEEHVGALNVRLSPDDLKRMSAMTANV